LERDCRQDNQALVAALLGIYSTEYRIFVKRIEENGKKKHKQFHLI